MYPTPDLDQLGGEQTRIHQVGYEHKGFRRPARKRPPSQSVHARQARGLDDAPSLKGRQQQLTTSLDLNSPRSRAQAEQVVPDPCQIARGTTGNTGESDRRTIRRRPVPSQVNGANDPRSPQLPKLRAQVRFSSPAPRQAPRSKTRGLFVV